MPLNRPTFDQLTTSISSVFELNLPETDTTKPASVLGVLITALAQACHSLYGFIASLATVPFIHLATENSQLDLFGMEYGVARRPATYATGAVGFTGTNGRPIAVGTLLQRGDGERYQTTTGGVIAAGVCQLSIEAISPGANTNTPVGGSLTLVSPLAGINSTATISTALTGGADEEAFTDYQARLLAFRRNRPRGGSVSDYELWTLEVADVTRVFVLPQGQGANSVVVLFMMDNRYPNGIAQAGDVATVTNSLTPLIPAGVELFVATPTASPLNLTINLSPNTPDVQASVTQALTQLIRAEARPNGTLLRSHIGEAISGAIGEGDHALLSPTGNVTTTGNAITVLGTITFGALS